MNIVHIDTSDNTEISVSLIVDEKKYIKKLAQDRTRAEEVLQLVDALVKEANFTLEKLTKIEVVKGPGSYTGLRVGMAIANTLSFALGIPVNDKKIGEIEIPQYNAL